jgi:hypothetical protein
MVVAPNSPVYSGCQPLLLPDQSPLSRYSITWPLIHKSVNEIQPMVFSSSVHEILIWGCISWLVIFWGRLDHGLDNYYVLMGVHLEVRRLLIVVQKSEVLVIQVLEFEPSFLLKLTLVELVAATVVPCRNAVVGMCSTGLYIAVAGYAANHTSKQHACNWCTLIVNNGQS